MAYAHICMNHPCNLADSYSITTHDFFRNDLISYKEQALPVLDVSKENATFATIALSYNITKTKGSNAAII